MLNKVSSKQSRIEKLAQKHGGETSLQEDLIRADNR